jgi:hypothetical protein
LHWDESTLMILVVDVLLLSAQYYQLHSACVPKKTTGDFGRNCSFPKAADSYFHKFYCDRYRKNWAIAMFEIYFLILLKLRCH